MVASRFPALPILVLLTLGGGCGSRQPASEGRAAPVSRLEDLARQFQEARAAGDQRRLTFLSRAVVPRPEDLTKLIDTSKPAGRSFLDTWKFADLRTDEKAVQGLGRTLFDPGDSARTEMHAYAATAKEMRDYVQGGTAWSEFPGGVRRFAAILSEGDRTWWVIEQVEPGKDSGMKYGLFTYMKDGRWLFFPKPWRAIPQAGGEEDAPR